jgi:hypothetical protein
LASTLEDHDPRLDPTRDCIAELQRYLGGASDPVRIEHDHDTDHHVIFFMPLVPREVNEIYCHVCSPHDRLSSAKLRSFSALYSCASETAPSGGRDHAHLQPLPPSSNEAQELKSLTEDYQQIRQQMHLVNQLTAVLTAYYPQGPRGR